jgi:hypothetical protein
MLPVAFGYFFFKTSINPTFDKLLPWTSSLKLAQYSWGSNFFSLPLPAAVGGPDDGGWVAPFEKMEAGVKNGFTGLFVFVFADEETL